MYVGADYYPEHWPRTRWETDAKLMQEAGFNIMRLAEFAWIDMEPTEQKYSFAKTDKWIEWAVRTDGTVLLLQCRPLQQHQTSQAPAISGPELIPQPAQGFARVLRKGFAGPSFGHGIRELRTARREQGHAAEAEQGRDPENGRRHPGMGTVNPRR